VAGRRPTPIVLQVVDTMKHQFTLEERRRGGEAGFRAAIAKVQYERNLEFNDAVCWLKRKIGWKSPAEMRAVKAKRQREI